MFRVFIRSEGPTGPDFSDPTEAQEYAETLRSWGYRAVVRRVA